MLTFRPYVIPFTLAALYAIIACVALGTRNLTKSETMMKALANQAAVTYTAVSPDAGITELAGGNLESALGVQNVSMQHLELDEILKLDSSWIRNNIQEAQTARRQASIASAMASRPGMVGRFVVPSAGIDVAVFTAGSNGQAVVNAKDSAAIIPWGAGSSLLADHNNQGFATLNRVAVGDTAYIETGTGKIPLLCTAVLNGHNTGHGITDGDGNDLTGSATYISYTCQNNWQNVRVCLWVYA